MSKRIQRVNSLIKREISQVLLREMEFPSGVLVTVTRVETSPGLKESDVWISVFPGEETIKIIDVLNKRIYFLQQKINQRLRMRPIPKISFLKEDKTGEADKIEELLEKLKKEGS